MLISLYNNYTGEFDPISAESVYKDKEMVIKHHGYVLVFRGREIDDLLSLIRLLDKQGEEK